MKHGDKITLNWLGSDVECEVVGKFSKEIGVPLHGEVGVYVSRPHGWDVWCFEIMICNDCYDQAASTSPFSFSTPQEALDAASATLGYKQPIPTAVAMMVDKVRCEEEGW